MLDCDWSSDVCSSDLRVILANLADQAAASIRPGLDHLLLSRCIDPLKPSDYA
jgi:hypothetical protein